VIDGRCHAALLKEAGLIFLTTQTLMQNLQGDTSALLKVFGLVDLSHSTASQEAFDSVGAELVARLEAGDRCRSVG
jgi:hypothetical protein